MNSGLCDKNCGSCETNENKQKMSQRCFGRAPQSGDKLALIASGARLNYLLCIGIRQGFLFISRADQAFIQRLASNAQQTRRYTLIAVGAL